jgi:hypothetical protein
LGEPGRSTVLLNVVAHTCTHRGRAGRSVALGGRCEVEV